MSKSFSWLVICLAALLAPSCGSSRAGLRRVVSYSPEASSSTDPTVITISFDGPVIGEEGVAKILEQVPVILLPAAPLVAHFKDRQTLVITPTATLKPSTEYQVSLTGELAKKSAPFSFRFTHLPLEVEGLVGVATDRLSKQPDLPLHFNQKVRVTEVLSGCVLVDDTQVIQFTAAAGDPAGESDYVVLKPAAALAAAHGYTLRCQGIRGAGGNTAMLAEFTQAISTYGPQNINASSPWGRDIGTDDVEITFTFANPVLLKDVTERLKAKPAISRLRDGWLDQHGTTYRAVVNLKPRTNYVVRIGKGLSDAYGQKTDLDYVRTFRTGDGTPRISAETGIFAIDATTPEYPVWSRNLNALDVTCAPVPRDKIVKVLSEGIHYDPWWYGESDNDIDWEKLGLAVVKRSLPSPKSSGNWHKHPLQLHELCGAKNPRGLFLALFDAEKISEHRYRDKRVLGNVTDLGLVLKMGASSGLVWVTALSTGKPVRGAEVTLYSAKGEQLFTGKSNAHGLVDVPALERLFKQNPPPAQTEDGEILNDWDQHNAQRVIALVEKDGDLAVVDGEWQDGLHLWNFGVETDRRGGEQTIRGFIQSDRGIYRPGEKVLFKGLVRQVSRRGAVAVPADTQVQIRVQDSRNATLLDERLTLSRFGGFDFTLPLPASAPTGDYQVTARVGKQTFNESFQVAEFKKLNYEVALKSSEPQAVRGGTFKFDLDANYLFGEPVPSAEIEWQITRRDRHISFAGFPEYAFMDYAARGSYMWWYDTDSEYGSFVADGKGTTDKAGHFSFVTKDDANANPGPVDYIAEVTVKDSTDQTVSQRALVTAHPSDFYLGIHTQEYVQAVGKPFVINAVAVDPAGKQRAVRGKLVIVRESWDCKQIEYDRYPHCEKKHEKLEERPVEIPATGHAVVKIDPKVPGDYVLRLSGKDSAGHEVSASSYTWVLGRGQAFWSGDESLRMGLLASKAAYQPGDTARLVPRTNMKNAYALVTLERNGIMEAQVKEIADAGDGIELELKTAHAPNVFATVTMVAGKPASGSAPRMQMGVVELKVSPERHRLEVEVKTNRDTYEPGQDISGTVVVTSQGKPVVAEVALSVADEGVLQLINYKTPDPMKSFYKGWGLGVDPASNYNHLFKPSEPDGASLEEGGDSPGGGELRVRSKFVNSAFWAPKLVTNENGQVSFQFKAPDDLTAFRLMAVAADTGSRFGSSDNRITIRKPLLLKPVLPRFLTSGDRAEVGVVVHNYTGQSGTATVTASAKGVTLSQHQAQVSVPKNDSVRVVFPMLASESSAATFEFSARMGGHGDAMAMTIPIQQPLVRETVTLARGSFGEEGGKKRVPISWDNSVVIAHSELRVSVDRLGMSELEPSLRYLIEYPYGCLEQTLSRFIPLTKVRELATTLRFESLKNQELESFISAGAAKVVRHQHTDGHFSLWPNGPTYPHLTAYALFGLLEAQTAGVKIDELAFKQGIQALGDWVSDGNRDRRGGEGATLAMAAYVLARSGAPDTGLIARLYEARQGLPAYGRAFLLRAMLAAAQAETTAAKELKNNLMSLETDAKTGLLTENLGDQADFYMSSDVRTTAIVLSALLEADADTATLDRLGTALKESQRPQGGWHNTQDNIYSLVALSAYAQRRAAGETRLTVRYNGKPDQAQTLSGGATWVWNPSLVGLSPGTAEISADGRAIYAVRLLRSSKDDGAQKANGFSVRREYVDAKTGAAVKTFKAGQLVEVRVRIYTPIARHWVALKDALPAGFEPVDQRLASSPTAKADQHDYTWTFVDLRDDQALAFADRLSAGHHTFIYRARASLPGTFAALPAQVEAMYEPHFNGRSASQSIEIGQ